MKIFSLSWRNAAIVCATAAAVIGLVAGLVSARFDRSVTAEMKEVGHELFVRQWVAHDPQAHGDGLGPVFNATSCVACHFQGAVGGGGDAAHNVVAYEVHPTVRDRKLQHGLVHAFAVDKSFVESRALVKTSFPIIAGGDRVVGGCTVRFEDFDPVRIETANSIALFGDGLIDRLSESTIRLSHVGRFAKQMGREFGGDFQTIGSGRPRNLPDGRLGRFGWKAQFATLEEFVAAACANELGLGNPLMQQAKPLGKEYSCDKADLTRKEFRQLVAFVEAIPRPVEVAPKDSKQREIATRGKKLFTSIGCAECHTPDLGNVAGLYSDLILHSLTSKESDGYQHQIIVEVPLPHDHPKPDEWRTPPLWGVADSAPYFHDGGSGTLYDAIQRHEGDALVVTKAFKALNVEDQQSLIAFLKTLRAPALAEPHGRPAANAVATIK
jgi:CxxC motif-containing protein (DUF1111 family)